MEVNGEIRSPDDTVWYQISIVPTVLFQVRILRHIQKESPHVAQSPITLTTMDRDQWAEVSID